jgi:hypothetical protein
MFELSTLTANELIMLFLAVCFVCGLIRIIILLLYKLFTGKPVLAERPHNARFLETWASGVSKRSLMTRLRGARNCLLVAVTDEFLILRLHFPFNLGIRKGGFDLEQSIPRNAIKSVKLKKSYFGESIEVVYNCSEGTTQVIELRLCNMAEFMRAMESPTERSTT